MWAFPEKQLQTLFHAYAVSHRLKKAMRNDMKYGIYLPGYWQCLGNAEPYQLAHSGVRLAFKLCTSDLTFSLVWITIVDG